MSPGAALFEVRGLRVRKGGADLLDIPLLAVAPGETLALIGPNGAGKSTLLLALSGIEQPAAGELLFRGERVPAGSAALAYRRRIAMVFQEPLLFDTTVFENVASGLRLRGAAREQIATRVADNLARFRISHLADRSARTLSGGEAQRTSLARALAVAPEILLLDEPFAALDPLSREALIEDLGHTLRETGTTTIFATHDRSEAVRLADRLAFLESGQVRQAGPVREVLERPADEVVAAFVGVENILPGVVESADGTLLRVACGAVRLVARGPFAAGSTVALCIRPERVVLSRTLVARAGANGGGNGLPGRVARIEHLGPLLRVTVDVGFPLVAFVPPAAAEDLALAVGLPVAASVDPAAVHLIPRS